jgi:hypothetical protein
MLISTKLVRAMAPFADPTRFGGIYARPTRLGPMLSATDGACILFALQMDGEAHPGPAGFIRPSTRRSDEFEAFDLVQDDRAADHHNLFRRTTDFDPSMEWAHFDGAYTHRLQRAAKAVKAGDPVLFPNGSRPALVLMRDGRVGKAVIRLVATLMPMRPPLDVRAAREIAGWVTKSETA